MESLNFLKTNFRTFIQSLRKVFSFKAKHRENRMKQILVAGGYGYGNTGDEAQCSETLNLLKKRYPDHQIKDLTPNPNYSYSQHKAYYHDFASRVLFYNQGHNGNCYDFDDNLLIKKIWFLISSSIIYLNAYLVRANMPTFLINAKKAKMLQELSESSLLYFCGGGFLTGKTRPRLWDGIILCRLCHLFKTPVVMSGQTIGVWNGKFNKAFAKWGFKHVKSITVRDMEFSLKDLKEIGIDGENIFYTHDDALFCEKSNIPTAGIEKPYFTLNFHYWGMQPEEKALYMGKINNLVSYVLEKTDHNLLFIPMHSTDNDSFEDYIKEYPNQRIKCLQYDYDFRVARRAIADSDMCITMKHHPIIFAMGEDVPTLSLAFSDYYVHKNVGALQQYQQENFSINLENADYIDNFKNLFDELHNNREKNVRTIQNAKEDLKQRKEKFLCIVDKILK